VTALEETTREVLTRTWVVSSDSHIVEPPDLWERHGDQSLGDRLPRVVSEGDGDWWYVDGMKTLSFLGIQTGDRFEKDATELRTTATFGEVRPAAYDPTAYVAENESDGIWGSVIYPSQGLMLFRAAPEVLTAAAGGYNEWVAAFCAHQPGRLKAIGIVNVDDPDDAAAELARLRDAGLCGAMITVNPPLARPFRHPSYERFWATAADLDLPISLHVATDRADPEGRDRLAGARTASETVFINKDYQVREALADIILSGVFERHPALRVGTVEHELGWIPFFVEQMDYTYTDRPLRGDWHRFAPGVLPSDFFRSNVFASFQEDGTGVRERNVFGVECLMWGSDYPHTESTFPRSREMLTRILQGVPDDEVVKIVSSNAARLYHFDLPG
jgi:predicted TIM-barrel fold metal-dependent hydrolase